MTIKLQRGRQFAVGDASVQVLDAKGKVGTYLQKAADKLVSQNISVVVSGPYNSKLTLATAADWKGFLEKNCANKAQTDAFVKKTGITFSDFLNAIDDAAASDDKGLTLDLRPGSELSKALSLDTTGIPRHVPEGRSGDGRGREEAAARARPQGRAHQDVEGRARWSARRKDRSPGLLDVS